MRLDALAFERQFIDHLAPIWHALPVDIRGVFYVGTDLVDYATRRGLLVAGRDRPDHAIAATPDASRNRPALVASYGDTKEARRLGYGPLAFIEHGIGQSYGDRKSLASGSYSGGPDRDDTSLFLVPGPDPAGRWQRAYPYARVEVVGCPRLDDLPVRDRTRSAFPTVAVSFHWPAPLSVSGYAGTAIGDFAPILPDIAKRWNTIGHAHPKATTRWRRVFEKARIPFVDDFDDVCRMADVYVCDNSSTIYEFAATGRPVVLLNARDWHRGPELGLRFWSASHVGRLVTESRSTTDEIARALEERTEDVAAREDALSLVYGYRTEGGRRAAVTLVDWMVTAVREAA